MHAQTYFHQPAPIIRVTRIQDALLPVVYMAFIVNRISFDTGIRRIHDLAAR